MKRLLGLALFALLWALPAAAQVPGGTPVRVVSACGSNTQQAGAGGTLTVDPTGLLCSNTSGGSSASSVNITAVGGNAVTTSLPVSGLAVTNVDNVTPVSTGAVPTQSNLYCYDSVGNNWDRCPTAAFATNDLAMPARAPVTFSMPCIYDGTLQQCDFWRNIASSFTDGSGLPGVAIAATSGIGGSATGVASPSAEACRVLKSSAGNLYSVYAVNLTATAGFLLILNTTSAPADGAVTPLDFAVLPSNGQASINYNPGPTKRYSTGITACLSSATTVFTKTTGVITGAISGNIQ